MKMRKVLKFNNIFSSFEIKYYPTKESGDFWNFTDNGFKSEMERSEIDIGLFASADPADIYYNYTGVHTGILLRLCMYQQKKRINYYQFIKTINTSCFKVLSLIGLFTLIIMYISGNNVTDCTFCFLAITFNQGRSGMLPTTCSVRTAIISFSISVLFFLYVSSASMTSLSVNDKDLGSTTIEEMNNSYIIQSLMVKYSSAHVMMLYSDLSTTFDKLSGAKIIKLSSVTDALTVTSKTNLFSFIERERVRPYWEEFQGSVSESNLNIMRPTLFLVRRNFPYTQAIRQELTRLMETGILSRLIKKWWPIIETNGIEFIPIYFTDVAVIFKMLSLGVIFSFLIFFIERHFGTTSG
ncbi:unnamed protein product [Nezara viridula]|uniref:Uncharacterized protein n=1 Tax=Nezara viridula TaxID=85310 RepID=A0A9P0MPQ2_NEZVI|nr:unnamed protein product [Nezara viridula]